MTAETLQKEIHNSGPIKSGGLFFSFVCFDSVLDGPKFQDQQYNCPVHVHHLVIQLHLVRITHRRDSAS